MTQIDQAGKTITLARITEQDGAEFSPERVLTYDSLVLAVGSQSNYFGAKGVQQHCLFPDSRLQAEKLHRTLLNRHLTANATDEARPMSIAIVGAGATGVELRAKLHHAVRLLDIDASSIANIVVTHLHYDHIGNFDRFPNARYHLQDQEMRFATGRHMSYKCAHEAYNIEDVVGMIRQVYKGRVDFHDGDETLAPGLSVHLVGGHTMGLQIVRVYTQCAWIVLASDASHYYRNFIEDRPFPIVFNVDDMVARWDRMRELADSEDHIVPGTPLMCWCVTPPIHQA